MARMRIVSVVDDTWGRGTVYGEDKEPSKLSINKSLPKVCIESKISINELEVHGDCDQKDNEEVQNETDYCGLSYLQASLFATILEDTIMEARILGACNNELKVWKTHVDMTLLITIKYSVSRPAYVDELDGIDPHHLGCSDYKLNKLYKDKDYFQDAIETAYKEMSLFKTFETVNNFVNSMIKVESDRIELIQDEAKNKILLRELNKQLRQQRNHIKTVIYDADTTIGKLKTYVEDASLNAEIRSRYVENWQRARTEQHLQTIKDTEADPSGTIEYYKRRTDYEQRVHSEVELLTNISINETLDKVDKWMEKYDKDMEALDLKIQIKKNEYQNKFDERIELENTIEKHDIMMKEWIHFKEEREKARLYREKMTNAAIVVQAWWRGLLVRRQLGPYKVSKKGAKGEKKK